MKCRTCGIEGHDSQGNKELCLVAVSARCLRMEAKVESLQYVVEAAGTVIGKNVSRPEIFLDSGDTGKYKLALALQALDPRPTP